MQSPVDICNTALSLLASRARVTSIEPSDRSIEADHCERFFPLARQFLGAMTWHFNTRRAILAIDANTPVTLKGDWSYAYLVPSDSLAMIKVLVPYDTDDASTRPYQVEMNALGQRIILTDAQSAILSYAFDQTNTGLWSPAARLALAYEVAFMLAGPMAKTPEMQKEMQRGAMFALQEARAHDGNSGRQGQERRLYVSDFVRRTR